MRSDVPDTEIVSARPTLANPGNTEFLDFEFSPSDLGFFGESFELPHLSTLDESATSRKDND
jgi:hypothetical protein